MSRGGAPQHSRRARSPTAGAEPTAGDQKGDPDGHDPRAGTWPASPSATLGTRRLWARGTGAVCLAILLSSCGPTSRSVGQWTLTENCPIPPTPAVDAASAQAAAEERLYEEAAGRLDPDSATSDALLACGLIRAEHRQAWSHSADEEDVWLLSFREGERLLAIAAIDADRGVVLAMTYGMWGAEPDEVLYRSPRHRPADRWASN
jgi:hypothetical protein